MTITLHSYLHHSLRIEHLEKWDTTLVDLSRNLDELKINQIIICVLSFRLFRHIWRHTSFTTKLLMFLLILSLFIPGSYYFSMIYHHIRKDVLSRLAPNETRHHVELSEPASCIESPISYDVSIEKTIVNNQPQHSVIVKDLKDLEEITKALSLKIRSEKQDYHLQTSRHINALFQCMGLEPDCKNAAPKSRQQRIKQQQQLLDTRTKEQQDRIFQLKAAIIPFIKQRRVARRNAEREYRNEKRLGKQPYHSDVKEATHEELNIMTDDEEPTPVRRNALLHQAQVRQSWEQVYQEGIKQDQQQAPTIDESIFQLNPKKTRKQARFSSVRRIKEWRQSKPFSLKKLIF